MNLLAIVCLVTWSRVVASYVIVNRDRDLYYTNKPLPGGRNYAENEPQDVTLSAATPVDPYAKKLLQLYYLVQVMRSYHRPAYQEPTTILSNLIDRLTKEDLRDELERLLSGVDGFEEVFNIGEYAVRDPIKEQLANDFRLLFPIVVKTLSGLQDGGMESDEMENTLQSKIRAAFNDFRSLLMSVVQTESEVFNEIEELSEMERKSVDNGVHWSISDLRSENVVPNVVEMLYVTQMPAASNKAVVNDYDLEVEHSTETTTEGVKEELATEELIDVRLQSDKHLDFLPDGRDVKYELSMGPDMLSQERDDSDEEDDDETELIILREDMNLHKDGPKNSEAAGSGPMAVLVKDPEMAALIPHIIEQLRMENVTPEEKDALAEIFEELWPLMVAEADRLRTEP
ncbi:uncharacterized protein LOC126567402 [Anopheles maculipalpis]|uniref:uncharacterized protein LOC126567402 n=1 Tax=Anopheles maculipalpis TaxID=1496333 RepID=UPI0021590A85|nr:uncharacterized protein LOC126567402 [Anopheles maculipalpis]